MGINPVALLNSVKQELGPHLRQISGLREIPPDASVEQAYSFYLVKSLLRKWEDTNERADSSALLKFLEADNRCKEWALALGDTVDEQLWHSLKEEVDRFFFKGPDLLFTSYYDLLGHGGVGPGSAIGARGESLYAKLFCSPMAVTSASLYSFYRDWSEWYPDWAAGELQRSSVFGDCSISLGSRMTFVPKNVDTSRLICVEPSLNMFYQKGLSAILEARMRELWKSDHSLQPDLNRLMSWEGSLTERFCTLDLESASDSVSLALLQKLLPSYVFDTLVELRSPSVFLPGLGWHELSMVSTMGNGFTFSLQSIIFSCIVRAAYRVYNVPIKDNSRFDRGNTVEHGNWAVFGDDLVVESDAVRGVERLLKLAGFSVNRSKSFSEGPFRESCGCDFYKGHNVRGVYLKRLTSAQDIVVAINLLNEWCARSGLRLPSSISMLMGSLRRPLFVPYQDGMGSGVRVPSHFSQVGSSARVMYERYEPVRKVVRFGDGTVHVPKGCKELIYSPHGLLMSFLRGELRDGTISVRHDRVRFRTKEAYVPWWDYMPLESVPFGSETDWLRWKSAVLTNLNE